MKGLKSARFILWTAILVGSSIHTTNSFAGTAVALRESFAGNLSFQLAAGSFRDSSSNICSTAGSASGSLSGIPINAEIKAAYLYWAASYNSSTETPDPNGVIFNGQRFTDPSPYTEIYDASLGWAFYSGKADVTSLVKSVRNGTYVMSDLQINKDSDEWVWNGGWQYVRGHCSRGTVLGGWSLVVIYEDDNQPFQLINVFDGFQIYYGSKLDLTPDNFEVASIPTGKHAHITWEGDPHFNSRNGFEESLTIRTSKGSFDLTDSANPANNQFNSVSNIYSASQSNTLGVDVDSYDISAYLTPGDKSFTSTYSSGSDMVILSAEILSVSNIPVADLSVQTSNPSSWLAGSTITKKYTISNNGPNDVPINSVEFNTTLPSALTFSGIQGDSDWSCSQTGQNLSCIYKPKLRAGWSDYLDITFDVGNVAGSNITLSANVNHDNAPYDIFDNQAANDIYQFTVPVSNTPVVDLSASSKTYTDVSGDLLLADDTLRYTITIDDASDLTANGITVTDSLPANIATSPSAYTIISAPVAETFVAGGGSNGTGVLTFPGIDLAAGTVEQIIYEVKVDANAQEGDSLRNTASISYNSDNWIVDTGDITVTIVEPDLSPSRIEAIDKNGGFLESGDTITVLVTLDDLYDSDISALEAIINIPDFIDSFNVINAHTGTDNSSSFIDIQNISFSNSETPTLEFEFIMDPAAVSGTEFNFSAELSIGANLWTLVAPTLTVLNSQVASAGNKQLYLDDSNNMSRIRPNDSTITINDESAQSWELTPSLASDLTFSLTDITIEIFLEGNRYRNNGNPQDSSPDINIELIDNNANLLASLFVPNFTIRPGRITLLQDSLIKNPAIGEDEITLSAGQTLTLSISGSDGNSSVQLDRSTTLHTFNVADSSLKADGFSAVILNASTVINVDNIEIWDKSFASSDSVKITQSQTDTNVFIRTTVSDPFGAFDITDSSLEITRPDSSAYDFSNDNTNMSGNDPRPDDNFMYEIASTQATKTFEKEIELFENQHIGQWLISITANEGTEGDVSHTQLGVLKVTPFQPIIALEKNITVLNDPINGTVNPKAIPSAELKYSITAKNSGRGFADDGSVVLKDEIPSDAELYIGNVPCPNRGNGSGLGPVCFNDGTTPNVSGLTYDFVSLDDSTDHLQFSQDGSDFTYVPVDAGDGYDDSVRFIRIAPIGNLNASDKNVTFQPEFTFEYQIRLK